MASQKFIEGYDPSGRPMEWSEWIDVLEKYMRKYLIGPRYEKAERDMLMVGYRLNKRGRPFGHRLSQATKDKISRSKTGYVHSEETKRKISLSVSLYWARRRVKSITEGE